MLFLTVILSHTYCHQNCNIEGSNRDLYHVVSPFLVIYYQNESIPIGFPCGEIAIKNTHETIKTHQMRFLSDF
jgi:hypothetical protein